MIQNKKNTFENTTMDTSVDINSRLQENSPSTKT
jgi:hypothetical protein